MKTTDIPVVVGFIAVMIVLFPIFIVASIFRYAYKIVGLLFNINKYE